MDPRRKHVIEGLKQSGLVFGGILLMGLFAWFFLWTLETRFDWRNGSNIVDILRVLGRLAVVLAVSMLSGPVPTLVIRFDITDKQVLILSCSLIIAYWVCLGLIAGSLRWNADKKQGVSLAKRIRWTIEITALVLAAIFFFFNPITRPESVSGRHLSPSGINNAVINNLRQMDAAKNQFALEKKVSPDYVPTEAELAPYLLHGTNFFNIVGGWPVRYVLNPINKPPYAIIDKDWRIRRRGLYEGFTITNVTIYRLP